MEWRQDYTMRFDLMGRRLSSSASLLQTRCCVPEEEKRILDWVHLPPGISGVSLWAGLHEAQIISIESSLLERTVLLNLEIEHVRIFYALPLDVQFLLRLEGVESARVLRYAVWPGPFSLPPGVSRDEEARLVAGDQGKWRERSRR